jgi:ABC-type transport system substrate-binding protein
VAGNGARGPANVAGYITSTLALGDAAVRDTPVARGTNYTKGQGSTFRVNPFWYGKKPGLKEINFRVITDTNTEEHIDIQFGRQGQPLLRAPWMRKALMMGIDRQAIIRTIYGELAGSTRPLNSLVY